MFKKLALLTISVALCATSLCGVHDYDAPIPAELKTVLDANCEQIQDWSVKCVQQPDWLPGWFTKRENWNPDRLEGAKRLTATIQELGYSDTVTVPIKYLYIGSNGKKFVIAQKHDEDKDALLTEADVRKLYKIFYKNSYFDAYQQNFLKDKQGKLVIIDTEIHSECMDGLNLGLSSLPASKLQVAVCMQHSTIPNGGFGKAPASTPTGPSKLDQQAQEYLKRKQAKYQMVYDRPLLFFALNIFKPFKGK